MFMKRDYVSAAITIYVFLVMFYFIQKENRQFKNVCFPNVMCVRFCCNDYKTCSEKFIKENFNVSSVPSKSVVHDNPAELRILYGGPTCTLNLVDSDHDWEFSSVRNILKISSNLIMHGYFIVQTHP